MFLLTALGNYGRIWSMIEILRTRVTDVVVTTYRVDPNQVRVLLYELPPEHWAVDGQTKDTQQSSFAQQQNEVDTC
jgi:phenylpyruvate tautomerase PptA (4-oxalocrotonate tautomerase family)